MLEARKIIVLIVPARAYDRGLLRGIARYANLHGPWIFYREPPFYRHASWRERVSAHLRSGDVDGVIMREPERIEEIVQAGVPAVCAPYTRWVIPDLVNVVTDNAAVGRMGAQHLLACEFRHFAFCGFDDIHWSRKRCEGFCKAIKEAGFDIHMYQQPSARGVRHLWERELPVIIKWLVSLPKPVGIMTCNDDRSQHVSDACQAADIHIPGEVAIIGVDNDDMICSLANPPLSSIALNPETMGYEAAGLLDKLMAGQDVEDCLVVGQPTHVIARQSTDITVVEDSVVTVAIRYVKLHCAREVQVTEVAEAVCVSRRTLEEHFHRVVRRSVYSEISRARADRVAKLLVETNLSISQIADKLGFSSIKQLDRMFKQQTSLTPTAYRHKYGHP